MSLMADFNEFWKLYPRRVGKLIAFEKYCKARKDYAASAEDILDGVRRYIRVKPDYADWAHPKTWLSQGRWMDEEDEAPAAKPRWECPHETTCNSKTWCLTLIEREREGWVRDSSGQWRQREAS